MESAGKLVIAAPAPEPKVNISEIFSRSWVLLRANPIVLAPLLIPLLVFVVVALVVAAIVIAVIAHGDASSWPRVTSAKGLPSAPILCGVAAMYIAGIALEIALFAGLYGLAAAAWTRGTATAADFWRAAGTRFWPTCASIVGFIGLGILAVLLVIPTLGVAFLALPLFTVFVFPAVVAGGRGGFAAIGESIRLVRANLLTSVLTVVLLYAVNYLGSFIVFPFIVPLQLSFMSSASESHGTFVLPAAWQVELAVFGYFLTTIITVGVFAFGSIVQTGMYLTLRERFERISP
jgi:hypothetical protein